MALSCHSLTSLSKVVLSSEAQPAAQQQLTATKLDYSSDQEGLMASGESGWWTAHKLVRESQRDATSHQMRAYNVPNYCIAEVV